MIKFDQLIKVLHDATLAANQALVDENLKIIDKYFESAENSESKELNEKSLDVLKPKTVVIQYPTLTQEGVVMKNVNVPLIALIPVSMSEVSEIKFKTNLEILADEDNTLKVSFPTQDSINKSLNASNNESHYSSLEITIRPHESSEGLATLIKGYEKALRAQLPN